MQKAGAKREKEKEEEAPRREERAIRKILYTEKRGMTTD